MSHLIAPVVVPNTPETRTYSAALYQLADQIEAEGVMTIAPETIRQAAQRLDEQTVCINYLKRQSDGLLESLEWLLNRAAPEWESESGVFEYAEACKHARSTIASVKGGA